MALRVEVDELTLSVRATLALQQVSDLQTTVDWLIRYAGVDEDELLDLPLVELEDVVKQVLKKLAPPKPNGTPSS